MIEAIRDIVLIVVLILVGYVALKAIAFLGLLWYLTSF